MATSGPTVTPTSEPMSEPVEPTATPGGEEPTATPEPTSGGEPAAVQEAGTPIVEPTGDATPGPDATTTRPSWGDADLILPPDR